jgi:undecaprenyl-diphosphatase
LSLLWTLILAVVQGLAEFFPISSSAHLTILGAIAGIKEQDALVFFLVLHFGTLMATVVFFWRDLLDLALGALRGSREAWRYILMVAAATVPTGILGLTLQRVTEKAVVTPLVPGVLLFFTAAYLWGTKYLPAGKKADGEISWLDAFLVGAAQGCAVIPGISRSGSSVSAGLARGLSRETAFKFSFLASLPAIAGAFLLEARHAFTAANPHLWDDVTGAAVSFVVGCLALRLWRKVVIRYGPHRFAPWCLVAGAAGIAVAIFKG